MRLINRWRDSLEETSPLQIIESLNRTDWS